MYVWDHISILHISDNFNFLSFKSTEYTNPLQPTFYNIFKKWLEVEKLKLMNCFEIVIKIYNLTSCEPHCSALVTYSFQLIHRRALCPEHISAHERRSTYRRSRMQSLNALQILLLG